MALALAVRVWVTLGDCVDDGEVVGEGEPLAEGDRLSDGLGEEVGVAVEDPVVELVAEPVAVTVAEREEVAEPDAELVAEAVAVGDTGTSATPRNGLASTLTMSAGVVPLVARR